MAHDIAWFIQTCQLCQLRKTQQVLIPPVVATPALLFAKVYMDMMHLTPSSGYKYIVQARCSLTHWPEWDMLQKESAKLLATFILHNIIYRWGTLPLHCADCFHSRDRHIVPSSSDSRDPGNPGIPSASGRDIYLADEDKCLCRGRQVFWPARLADQQRVVASQVTQVRRPDKTSLPAKERHSFGRQWLCDPLDILCYNILVK